MNRADGADDKLEEVGDRLVVWELLIVEWWTEEWVDGGTRYGGWEHEEWMNEVEGG